MKKYALILTTLILTNNSLALNAKQGADIHGNPLHQQNTYTVNSQQQMSVTLSCELSNKSKVPAVLNIWTAPDQQKPVQQILINSNQKNKLTLELALKDHWWCSIYLPKEQHAQRYCHYFAISDATLSHYRPFATWNTTTRAKDAHYQCSLSKGEAKFFYFE